MTTAAFEKRTFAKKNTGAMKASFEKKTFAKKNSGVMTRAMSKASSEERNDSFEEFLKMIGVVSY